MKDLERRGGATRIGWIVAVALALGAVTGTVFLYSGGAFDGNALADASCPADSQLAQALNERAHGEVAAVQALDEPVSVADLAFTDAEGQPATLADFSGSALLVNLWATWCVPCREEMPALDALERAEGGPDFRVIPINVDTGGPEKPRDFYEETELNALPLYRDETMGVFDRLKSTGLAYGLPVSLLVDREGCVRASINGPAAWASPDAVELIDVLRQQRVTQS